MSETSQFVITAKSTNTCLTERLHTEFFNMERLQAVIKSKKVCKPIRAWWKNPKSDNNDHIPQYEIEREYYNNLMKNMRCKEKSGTKYWFLEGVQYFGSKNSGDYGRVYPKDSLSLGVMRRPIRHFLAENDYYDVDIINAHLQIAKQKCKEFGLPCDMITEYCDRRDEILQEIMDETKQNRDFAKKIFIIILNGGSWKHHFKRHKVDLSNVNDFIIKYEKEIKMIQKFLIEKYRDSLYPELTKDKESDIEKMRTFMAKYFQMIEVEILKYVVMMVSEEDICNINELVLAHDGFMIRKHYLDNHHTFTCPQDFIDYLNDRFQEELDFEIEFKLKPFDEAQEIKDILNEEGINWNEKYVCPFLTKYGMYRHEVGNLVGTDNDFAEAFVKKNMNNFISAKVGETNIIFKLNEYGVFKKMEFPQLCKEYVEYMEDFMKEVEKSEISTITAWCSTFMKRQLDALQEYYMIHNITDKNDKDNLLGYKATQHDTRCVKICNSQLKKLETKWELAKKVKLNKVYNQASKKQIVGRVMELFFNQSFLDEADTMNHLLGFDDGVIDLNTKEFRKAKPENDEFITMSCGYKMGDVFEDEKYQVRKKELEKILMNMFETKSKYRLMMKSLARSLRCEANKEELAFFFKGVGRNGKGLLIELLKYVFGEYCGRLDYSYFTYDNKGSAINVKLAQLEKARIAYTDEPPAKLVFITDIFKDATGQGEISCRELYSNKVKKFVMPPLLISANFTIKFDSDTGGESMINRIVGVKFPYTFISDGDERLEKNPKKYKVGNMNLKDQIKAGYFNEAMMLLLLEFYGIYEEEGLRRCDFPEEVKRDTKEYLAEISEEKAWFDNTIEITDKKCYLSVKELFELWQQDTKTKRGIKYFQNKIMEYYGPESIEKNVRKAYRKWEYSNMTEEDKLAGKTPSGGKRMRSTIRAVFKPSYLVYDSVGDDEFDSDDE